MYIENTKLRKYIAKWLLGMCLIVSIMIIVGGLTRLTDSGLSITQWQLFSGTIPPLTDFQWNQYFDLYKKIPEYKLQNFTMSLDEFKVIFWWEFIHRLLGRLIGISFLIPLIFFSIKLGFNKTKNFLYIFFLICFQGFIGWYMVSSGLIDRVDVSHYRLSLHLSLAFVILGLLFWQYLNLINLNLPTIKMNFHFPLVFLFLIFLQIIFGAFVSGMDAGMIYNTWPLMGSSYFPDDNLIVDFFTFSVFNEPSLVQFIHRNLAYLISILYLIIFVYIRLKNLSDFIKTIYLLGTLLLLQIILGIFTLLSGAQILLASMHQISSIFLVLSTIYLVFINLKTNQQL
jgi:cytochrome c oxidase assembly protein subunit 15